MIPTHSRSVTLISSLVHCACMSLLHVTCCMSLLYAVLEGSHNEQVSSRESFLKHSGDMDHVVGYCVHICQQKLDRGCIVDPAAMNFTDHLPIDVKCCATLQKAVCLPTIQNGRMPELMNPIDSAETESWWRRMIARSGTTSQTSCPSAISSKRVPHNLSSQGMCSMKSFRLQGGSTIIGQP